MASSNQFIRASENTRFNESEAIKCTDILIDNPVASRPNVLNTSFVRTALPFINGGLAGIVATTVIQPIDMVKVRLQLAGEGARTGSKASPLSIAREIISSGRIADFYTGLSAGLLRQAVYTTARLGIFETLMKNLTLRASLQGKEIGFKERAVAGLVAGGSAAIIGNPADLALIRMQADGMKPFNERKSYRNVISALRSIGRTEGVATFWAGGTPTVYRAMALNFGQLAFFSEAKKRLKDTSLGPNIQTFGASAIAGFFASFFSLPFDFTKTRLQKQTRNSHGELTYRGMFDCFAKVAREEGVLRFYRGFGTYYARIAPHVMLTMIVADYLGFVTK